MKDLIIIGAGDFGREIINVAERINEVNDEKVWNVLGYVDDNKELWGKIIDGYEVLGDVAYLNGLGKETFTICSIGVAKTRKKVINKVNNPMIKWATIIDPDARVYKDATVGEGTILCGGCVLAINSKVGNHVVANINCIVGHDAVVGDYTVINPAAGLSGKVTACGVNDFGTGCRILQGIAVAEEAVIGAGGVVLKNIDEPGTYVGVPVKRVK